MRALLVILSFLLTLFGEVGTRSAQTAVNSQDPGIHRQTSLPAQDAAPDRTYCLATAPSSLLEGSGHGGQVSARPVSSVYRPHSSVKSTTRMLKAGKVLCVRQFKSFLAAAPLAESGRQTSERYLFSICRLRL